MLCVQGHATVALLKAMVQAYCRRRTVLKLDTWHTLALPLFRSAFPSVPWLYLYREPGEVLASRMRQEGTQSLPQPFEHMLPGLGPGEVLTQEEHCARVLARTCEAAAASAAGRLLVNYSELPDAVLETILPHFGLDTLVPGRVRAAARFDAKAPSKSFAADSRAKQEALTGSLGSIAAREVGPAYRRLEALRTGALAAGVPD
jgi:hypothetical protein